MTFYCVEGPDGAGKTSAVDFIRSTLLELTGEEPLVIAFPKRDTPIGSLIAECLRGERKIPTLVLHQLFSANRLEMSETIAKALYAGRSVIADRYLFSGAAYTLAANARATARWCLMHEIMSVAPNRVFWLNANADVCLKRIEERGEKREVYEKKEFLEWVCKTFGRVFSDEGFHASSEIESFLDNTELHEIDANANEESVQNSLRIILETVHKKE